MASDDLKPYHEGPDAAARFERTLRKIVKVPKAELDRREAAYKKSRRTKTASQKRA
jgi:hypothetical protein